MTNLDRLCAALDQARRDLADGIICQADYDYIENQRDQALATAADNAIARNFPEEN